MSGDDGYRSFQRRIMGTPLLTAAEEVELARRIEAGDAAARERLIESNLRLVAHLARQFRPSGGSPSLMELIQEGSVGLIRAVEKYDHRRGARFATYASWWIREGLHRALREREAPGTSLDDAPSGESDVALVDLLPDERAPEPGAALADEERRSDVDGLLSALRPSERRALELRFGLRGERPRTAREAAGEMRTTEAQLRKVERLALRRLGALPAAGALREAA